MNPLSGPKTVVGIPQQANSPEGAPIAGVHVLGHGDMAEQTPTRFVEDAKK